jgi:L-threonylcarbamoyladenylate synthase
MLGSPWQTEMLAAFEPAPSRTPNERALGAAENWLRRGVPVVIPTETVYGLAAPALDQNAVQAIFQVKRRPLDNPLIAHVSGLEQLALLGARCSQLALQLAEAFWPGPLTLVVPTEARLPWVTAGLDSIAIRHPAHEFAAALIRRVGPLAAPSANLSGLPSPTRASHVARDLGGLLPLIVDGGDLEHGLESTVLDVRGTELVLLRPGALAVELIEAAVGHRVRLPGTDTEVRAPGMKYRHYSPRAELWLYPTAATRGAGSSKGVRGEPVSVTLRLARDAALLRAAGRRVGAIARRPVDVDEYIQLPDDPRRFARQLFSWLRELDERGVDCVLVEGVATNGVGRAIMDRLARAASRVQSAEPDALALGGLS